MIHGQPIRLDDIEQRVRSIVAACRSPGACDIARIERKAGGIVVSLRSYAIEINPTARDIDIQLSHLKSLIVSLTGQVRANAMLGALGISPSKGAFWLVSTSRFATEWLRWTSTAPHLHHLTNWAQHWPSSPLFAELGVEDGDRKMRFVGGFHQGVLSPTVHLSTSPACRFTTAPTPSIVVEASALPETVVDGLNAPSAAGANAIRSVSEIVSHPFFDVYDPIVADIANDDGRVVIGIDDERTTLEPVPAAALRILPPGFNPARPWEPTAAERQTLRKIRA